MGLHTVETLSVNVITLVSVEGEREWFCIDKPTISIEYCYRHDVHSSCSVCWQPGCHGIPCIGHDVEVDTLV